MKKIKIKNKMIMIFALTVSVSVLSSCMKKEDFRLETVTKQETTRRKEINIVSSVSKEAETDESETKDYKEIVSKMNDNISNSEIDAEIDHTISQETTEETLIENNFQTETGEENKVQIDISDIYINRSRKVSNGNEDFKSVLREKVANKTWEYGKSPIEWTYIEPNKKIISNFSPNSSTEFSIKLNTTSGDKGCYIPILKCDEYSDIYEGRFFCFKDAEGKPSQDPLSFRVLNKIYNITYEGQNIGDIFKKSFDVNLTSNGLMEVDGNLVNIIYLEDLDKMLGR